MGGSKIQLSLSSCDYNITQTQHRRKSQDQQDGLETPQAV